jgi:hypothetical protein
MFSTKLQSGQQAERVEAGGDSVGAIKPKTIQPPGAYKGKGFPIKKRSDR